MEYLDFWIDVFEFQLLDDETVVVQEGGLNLLDRADEQLLVLGKDLRFGIRTSMVSLRCEASNSRAMSMLNFRGEIEPDAA